MSFDTIEEFADHMANLQEYPLDVECKNCLEMVKAEEFNEELECNSDNLNYCKACDEAFETKLVNQ